MKYQKPPLSFEQQADLLLQRGMIGDKPTMVARLSSTNYYRLSGYWYPFRQRHPTNPAACLDTFQPGTSFDEVWSRYVFDRRLRLLVMDAIERVEVAVRSHIANQHASRHGMFAYADDRTALPGLDWTGWGKSLAIVRGDQSRSKDTFVRHFVEKYGDCHGHLPVWMAAEVMSFGSLPYFLKGCAPDIRKAIAAVFGVHENVFDSWMLALNTVRNVCAHHGRLWNKEFGVKPKIPDKLPAWQTPVTVAGDRTFGVLTICRWSIARVAPQSGWPARIAALLDGSPSLLQFMGFPTNWKQCPIWVPPAARAGA